MEKNDESEVSEGRFKSVKASKPGFLSSIVLVVIMTVCWIFVVVSVDLVRRPAARRELDSNPLNIFSTYKELFAGIDDAGYNEALSGLFGLLAGVATLTLILKGMTWPRRDLPVNRQMHSAWLQRVVDTSVRESAAMVLMAVLCGAYGLMVVCYGFMAGSKGWEGLGLPFFIVLLMLYVVVATLPAFILKSDAGEVSGYVATLTETANIAEWRYRNQCDSILIGESEEDGGSRRWRRAIYVFLRHGYRGLWGFLGRFACLIGLTVFSVGATVFFYSRTAGWFTAAAVILYLLCLALLLEGGILQVLSTKALAISVGRKSFDVVFLSVLEFTVALMMWVAYAVLTIRTSLGFVTVFVLFAWWGLRIWCACVLKPRGERPSELRSWLEEAVGLRCVIEYWLDRELLEKKERLVLYSSKGVQITEELSVAAGLVVPENSVVRRGSESVRLRDYLSNVVGLSLPSMDTSSTGSQSESSSGGSSSLEGARPEVINGAYGLPTPSQRAGRRGHPRRGVRRRRRALRGRGGWRRR